MSTSNSEPAGRRKSTAAKSSARGAAGSSTPARRGISATTTSTETSTPAPNTAPATGRRRRIAKTEAGLGDNSPIGGPAKVDRSVVAAVERDLDSIRRRDPELAVSALACTALALARELDNDNSATSKSMCAKAIIDAMAELRQLCPPEEKADELDELKRRRDQRIAGQPAS